MVIFDLPLPPGMRMSEEVNILKRLRGDSTHQREDVATGSSDC